jgi:hypothetical protein
MFASGRNDHRNHDLLGLQRLVAPAAGDYNGLLAQEARKIRDRLAVARTSVSVGASVVRKTCLVPLLVVWSGCDGQVDLGGDSGRCDAALVDVGPAAPAADATLSAAADAASGQPDAFEAAADAQATDAMGDGAPVADALAESTAIAPDAGDHCADRKQDFDESDVDCGGSCPPCGPSKVCFVDADCSPTASGCDADAGGCYCVARALVCVYSHCLDGKKDVDETDLDCGGLSCSPCAVGLRCLVDSDCGSKACDARSSVCLSNQCVDHHQDGSETDVDCGGAICNSCAVGQRCNSGLDCQSGHTCSGDAGVRVCQ